KLEAIPDRAPSKRTVTIAKRESFTVVPSAFPKRGRKLSQADGESHNPCTKTTGGRTIFIFVSVVCPPSSTTSRVTLRCARLSSALPREKFLGARYRANAIGPPGGFTAELLRVEGASL